MATHEPKYATYEQGGLLRCCAAAIPVDGGERILAGTEGQHIPCPHCKTADSGVKFVKGRWIAAWRK